jgi:hypothetical protein
MKKILLIILFSFLWCGNSYAILINLKCVGFKSYNISTSFWNNNFEDVIRLIVDTNKRTMTEKEENNKVWIIAEERDGSFYSKNSNILNYATLNRYTGVFISKLKKNPSKYFYICQKAEKLF